MNTKNETEGQPQVGSDDLLGLGLYVIEMRSRRRDKSLTLWGPVAAFVLESNAEAYMHQYNSIGFMRLSRPNDQIHPR